MLSRSIFGALVAVALCGSFACASGDDEAGPVVSEPLDDGSIPYSDDAPETVSQGDVRETVTAPVLSVGVEAAPAYSVVYPFPPLSYNHYYPAYDAGVLPARLYFCPRPVPPYVGYTYITYQPLAPHELLWVHSKAYYQYHPGSGTTYTTIEYR